ncbi:glycosyltransferase family 4 protein [Agrococcus beijingensis]|uniref:glycosyltransferase family 4 protein n=1 Tax=Agrococcus beijingensis TaxID=3068634 RepID=UPI0027425A66|nr:glycosyltransferase family 4 protein [Agrococcus sp. REN33]
MRVTWIALEWPRVGMHSGGVGRYVQRLAERTRALVDLTVICFEGAVPMEGVRLVTLPAPRGRVGRYYGSAIRASRAVRGLAADVVHSHGDDVLLPAEVPLVRTFYGSSLGEARTSRGLRRLNHYVLALLERRSAGRATVKLGIAPESVELMGCDAVLPPYFGVPPVPREPSATPSVVFIGSFGGRKQGHVAQAAVEALRAEGREIDLIVVGPKDDADAWQPWVQHRAGLADHEVAALLGRAWALVSPSAYEGFGIPVLEGLDHGLPVVAHPNPGSEYLRSLASGPLPLDLATGAAFTAALRTRIEAGPQLSEAELQASRALIEEVLREGSPERLVAFYADAVERARSRA